MEWGPAGSPRSGGQSFQLSRFTGILHAYLKFFEASTSRSLINLFGQSLTSLKNLKTRSREAMRGIVYKIKCKDCDCVYIGQTSRALKTRVKEHAKAIETLDDNSLLAKHHMLHSHRINLASVEIIDRSSAWRQSLILEAWHSVRDTNAINEHIALPNIYNVEAIKNTLETFVYS